MIKRNFIKVFLVMLLFNSCTDYTSDKYLKIVLENLDRIETATYTRIIEIWHHGDTTAAIINFSYVKEYSNPADSTIGSKFVVLDRIDTTKLNFCYDGQMRAIVYDENEAVVIDNFTARPLPFRPLTPPFFNFAKSIINYAIETKDSIQLDISDLKDSVYMKLTIFEENQIEFFGKAHRMPISPYSFDNTSMYEIWIDKSTNLPYKVRREMSHNISVTICKDLELNKLNISEFNAADYFPDSYTIRPYRLRGDTRKEHRLIGEVAPNWTLKCTDDSIIRLSDLKSKVVLIQFTSVSCGPCRLSIPFLKHLEETFDKKKLDFVAIECTSRNLEVLKTYSKSNDFNFKFLLSTKEVTSDYSVNSFPIFFILDESRIIRNVIIGYTKDDTDREIINFVNKLI